MGGGGLLSILHACVFLECWGSRHDQEVDMRCRFFCRSGWRWKSVSREERKMVLITPARTRTSSTRSPSRCKGGGGVGENLWLKRGFSAKFKAYPSSLSCPRNQGIRSRCGNPKLSCSILRFCVPRRSGLYTRRCPPLPQTSALPQRSVTYTVFTSQGT